MGVQGLLKFILSNTCTREKVGLKQFAKSHLVKTGRQPELLCDFTSVVTWLLSSMDHAMVESGGAPPQCFLYGGVLKRYSERVLSFVEVIQNLGVSVVFFVESCPVTKDELSALYETYTTDYSRKQEEAINALQICASYQDMSQLKWSLKESVVGHVIFTLECAANVQVMYCHGQVMSKAISYMQTNQHVCGILSSNTSYAIGSGCGLFLIDLFGMDVKRATPSLPHLKEDQDLTCEVVWSTWLASSLDISLDQLADMAILCGNEYTRLLNKKSPVLHALGISHANVLEVVRWLRRQGGNLADVDIMKEFLDSNPRYQEVMEISHCTYSPSKLPQSADVLDVCPVLKQAVSVGGFLSPQMVSIVVSGVYWRPALIEPEVLNCPRFCDVTLLIRMFVYALVGMSGVTEVGFITGNSNLSQIPVEVISHVELPPLLSLSKNERLSILYRLITYPGVFECAGDFESLVSTAVEDSGAVAVDVPSDGIILLCTMIFMRAANTRMKPSPKIFICELEALLMTILFSISGLPPLNIEHIPPAKGVTLASWYSHVLEQTYWLAACLGLSRDLPPPGQLFSAQQYIPFHLASNLCEDLEEGSFDSLWQKLQQVCVLYQEVWKLPPVLELRAELLLKESIPPLSKMLPMFTSSVEAVSTNETLRELADPLKCLHSSSSPSPSESAGGFTLDLDDSGLSAAESALSQCREELSFTQECNATEEDHYFSSPSLGPCMCEVDTCEDMVGIFDSGSDDSASLVQNEYATAQEGDLVLSDAEDMSDAEDKPGDDSAAYTEELAAMDVTCTTLCSDSTDHQGEEATPTTVLTSGDVMATTGATPTSLDCNVETTAVENDQVCTMPTSDPSPAPIPHGMGGKRKTTHYKAAKKRTPHAKVPEADLPIMDHRSRILQLIREHTVVCIEGETGCGKSTKVPQFILEDALSEGEGGAFCRILVTQPRRVAAIKLAERVAAERGEQLGDLVGYCVGGDHHKAAKTRLTYCTTGYLLQTLVHHPMAIRWYSHIVLDEIHERSTDADFAMLVVRKLVSEAGGAKIILMSATMQGNLLVNYFEELFHFSNVSSPYFVGSKRYPVQNYFINQLEVLADESSKVHWHEKQELACNSLRLLIASQPCENLKASMSAYPRVSEYAMNVCTQVIIAQSRPGESVLVFLPGIATISKYYDILSQYLEALKLNNHFRLFILHSQVPLEDQKDAFMSPPVDTVYVILATNIAESSITLPKLRLVVNFGIFHQLQYDQKRRISCLKRKWCSHASCTQRAGRAGRVFDGICVHLFTKKFYDVILPQFDQPEILTAPLAKLVLQAKVFGKKLGIESPSKFLCSAIEQPSLEQMQVALQDLADLGAIASSGGTDVSEEADITLLGYFSLSLPIDLSLCRLVLFGVFFGVPLEGITIAAFLSLYQDVFTLPSRVVVTSDNLYMQMLKRSTEARVYFDGGQYSDAVMACNMFREWIEFRNSHLCNADTKSKHSLIRSFCKSSAVRWERLLQLESSVACIAAKAKAYVPKNHKIHTELLELVSLTDNRAGMSHLPTGAGPRGKRKGKGRKFSKVHVHFCEDVLIIKALMTASFSNQILVGSSSVNSPNVQLQKQARKSLKVMKSCSMDPAQSLIMSNLVNPQLHSLHRLVMTLVPRRQFNVTIHGDTGYISLLPKFGTNPKTMLMVQQAMARGENLVGTDMENARWNPFMMEQSIAEIKLSPDLVYMWQFGERKYEWTISGVTDIFTRPQHPLIACWTRLASDGASAQTANWRQPSSLLLTEENRMEGTCLAVAATLKGFEGTNRVIIRDLTVLPNADGCVTGLLLVLAFQPLQASVSLLVDPVEEKVVGMKVRDQQVPFKDNQYLTRDDLVRVNALRSSMSEVLSSFCEDEAQFPMEKIAKIHSLLDCVMSRSPNDLAESAVVSLGKPLEWNIVEYDATKNASFFEEFEYPSIDTFCYYPQMKCKFMEGVEVSDIPDNQLRVSHLFHAPEIHSSSIVFSLSRDSKLRQNSETFKLSPLAKTFVPKVSSEPGEEVKGQRDSPSPADISPADTQSVQLQEEFISGHTQEPTQYIPLVSQATMPQSCKSRPVTTQSTELALFQPRPALSTVDEVSFDASHVASFFPACPGFGPIPTPLHGHFGPRSGTRRGVTRPLGHHRLSPAVETVAAGINQLSFEHLQQLLCLFGASYKDTLSYEWQSQGTLMPAGERGDQRFECAVEPAVSPEQFDAVGEGVDPDGGSCDVEGASAASHVTSTSESPADVFVGSARSRQAPSSVDSPDCQASVQGDGALSVKEVPRPQVTLPPRVEYSQSGAITSSASEQQLPFNTNSRTRQVLHPPSTPIQSATCVGEPQLLHDPVMRYAPPPYAPPSAYTHLQSQLSRNSAAARELAMKNDLDRYTNRIQRENMAHCTGQYRGRYQHPPWVSKVMCAPAKVDPAHVYDGAMKLPVNTTHVYRGPPGAMKHPVHVYSGPPGAMQHPAHVYSGPPEAMKHPAHVYNGPPEAMKHPAHVYNGPSEAMKHPAHVYGGPPGAMQHPAHVYHGPSEAVQPPTGPTNVQETKLEATWQCPTDVYYNQPQTRYSLPDINTNYIPPVGSIWNDLVGTDTEVQDLHKLYNIEDNLLATFLCNYLKMIGGCSNMDMLCGPVYKYFLRGLSIPFNRQDCLHPRFFMLYLDRFSMSSLDSLPIRVTLKDLSCWQDCSKPRLPKESNKKWNLQVSRESSSRSVGRSSSRNEWGSSSRSVGESSSRSAGGSLSRNEWGSLSRSVEGSSSRSVGKSSSRSVGGSSMENLGCVINSTDMAGATTEAEAVHNMETVHDMEAVHNMETVRDMEAVHNMETVHDNIEVDKETVHDNIEADKETVHDNIEADKETVHDTEAVHNIMETVHDMEVVHDREAIYDDVQVAFESTTDVADHPTPTLEGGNWYADSVYCDTQHSYVEAIDPDTTLEGDWHTEPAHQDTASGATLGGCADSACILDDCADAANRSTPKDTPAPLGRTDDCTDSAGAESLLRIALDRYGIKSDADLTLALSSIQRVKQNSRSNSHSNSNSDADVSQGPPSSRISPRSHASSSAHVSPGSHASSSAHVSPGSHAPSSAHVSRSYASSSVHVSPGSHAPSSAHVSPGSHASSSVHVSPGSHAPSSAHVSPGSHASSSAHVSPGSHAPSSAHVSRSYASSSVHVSPGSHAPSSAHVSPGSHAPSSVHVSPGSHAPSSAHVSPGSHAHSSVHVSPSTHSSIPDDSMYCDWSGFTRPDFTPASSLKDVVPAGSQDTELIAESASMWGCGDLAPSLKSMVLPPLPGAGGGPKTTLAPPTIDAIRSEEASEHLTIVSSRRPSSAPVGQRCGGSYPLHSLKCSPGEEGEGVTADLPLRQCGHTRSQESVASSGKPDMVFYSPPNTRGLGSMLKPVTQSYAVAKPVHKSSWKKPVKRKDSKLVGAKADADSKPVPVGDKADTDSKPVPVGDKADTDSKPVPVGAKADTNSKPVLVGAKADTNSKPVPAGAKADTDSKPVPVGAKADTDSKPVPVGAEVDTDSKPVPVGAKADTHSKPVAESPFELDGKSHVVSKCTTAGHDVLIPCQAAKSDSPVPCWVEDWVESDIPCQVGGMHRTSSDVQVENRDAPCQVEGGAKLDVPEGSPEDRVASAVVHVLASSNRMGFLSTLLQDSELARVLAENRTVTLDSNFFESRTEFQAQQDQFGESGELYIVLTESRYGGRVEEDPCREMSHSARFIQDQFNLVGQACERETPVDRGEKVESSTSRAWCKEGRARSGGWRPGVGRERQVSGGWNERRPGIGKEGQVSGGKSAVVNEGQTQEKKKKKRRSWGGRRRDDWGPRKGKDNWGRGGKDDWERRGKDGEGRDDWGRKGKDGGERRGRKGKDGGERRGRDDWGRKGGEGR